MNLICFFSFEMTLYRKHHCSYRVHETFPYPGDYDEVVKKSESKYAYEFDICGEIDMRGLRNEHQLSREKTYSKELQGSTYPIARQSGARKKSIKEVDLDKFSSDSYVNSYWKKN